MEIIKKLAGCFVIVAMLGACGGAASEDPVTTTTRPGESIGFADAIERTQEVADLSEDRTNSIDEMFSSE